MPGIKAFIAYSHVDEPLKDELVRHLSGLVRSELITDWNDRKILAGQDWDDVIDSALSASELFLLLISADFLYSGYCVGIEARRAMERHAAGEALVIPVVLRPTVWRHYPFSSLQALPKDANAVTSWSNKDEALVNVVDGIENALKHWLNLASAERSSPEFADRLSAAVRDESSIASVPPFAEREGETTQTLAVVGIGGDSQTGPISRAPDGQRGVSLPSDAARLLSFYGFPDHVILAPRDWDGEISTGSAGSTLSLRPRADAGMEPSLEFVVEIYRTGSTSGRDFVRRFGPPLFVDRDDWKDFAIEAFPATEVTRVSETLTLFRDGPRQTGIGTAMCDTPPADMAVFGCAVLVPTSHDTPDINVLIVRLSGFHDALSDLILREFGRGRVVR